MSSPATSTMRRDILSAYAVSAARVASWIIVSAYVFRRFGSDEFGLVALLRTTVGILGYTAVGLGPAMVSKLAAALAKDRPLSVIVENNTAGDVSADTSRVMSYSRAKPELPPSEIAAVYASGEFLANVSSIVAFPLVILYASLVTTLHDIPSFLTNDAPILVLYFGTGVVLRLLSEPAGALLQIRGHIAADNWILFASEIAWAIGTVGFAKNLADVGAVFVVTNVLLLGARYATGWGVRAFLRATGRMFEPHIAAELLRFGLLVAFAQFADFLYAPTDLILINRLINASAVAIYYPAIQIDTGLLLLVSAIAGVLFPKAAIAHAAGQIESVRAYYVRGTLASSAILLCSAIGVWAMAPVLFPLWLREDMPGTQAILPLVLIHTVVGGSSMVGRSILLGMGRVKPFTISVLIAGAANVLLSIMFVQVFHLGLRGIIYGTIIAVVGRCAIWMPWYVMKTLREGNVNRADGIETEVVPPVV